MIDLVRLAQTIDGTNEGNFVPVSKQWLRQALAELEQGRAAQAAVHQVQGTVLDLEPRT